MVLACSHVTLATSDVPRMTRFLEMLLGQAPYFENDMFSEFVLPSRFRIALFKPVGASAKSFHAESPREASALGLTFADVDEVYRRLESQTEFTVKLSGPPRDHPWGEKSFLLTDPDGNRWEIVLSPSTDGMLKNK